MCIHTHTYVDIEFYVAQVFPSSSQPLTPKPYVLNPSLKPN